MVCNGKNVNPMFSQLGVRVFKGEGSSFGNELLMRSSNQWNSHSSPWKKAQQPRHCKDRPSLEVHPQDIARDSHVCCWQIVFNLVDLEILKHLATTFKHCRDSGGQNSSGSDCDSAT